MSASEFYALKPIEPPYAEEIAAVLARYPQRGGHLLSLFRTFANSLRFLSKGVPNLLDEDSPLPLRDREIVILRVTANLNCEYEWGVHVAAFARQAAFSADQIAATRNGDHVLECWSDRERLLIAAVDQLCANATLDEACLAKFQSAFTREQQLEIIALSGAYHTVSYVANVARLPNEPFGASFP